MMKYELCLSWLDENWKFHFKDVGFTNVKDMIDYLKKMLETHPIEQIRIDWNKTYNLSIEIFHYNTVTEETLILTNHFDCFKGLEKNLKKIIEDINGGYYDNIRQVK